MSVAAVSFRTGALPWAASPDDDARFKRVLQSAWFIILLLALLFKLMPRPVEERAAPQPLPAPMARLLIDKPLPPPPPVKPHEEAAQVPEKKVEAAKQPEKTVPVPKNKPPAVVEARNPVPNKPPGEVLGEARRKAAGVGLLAMKDDIAELHSAPVAVQLNKDIKPGVGVGSGTGPGVGAGTDPGIPIRNMITSNATNGSGGINVGGYSHNSGGGGLAGRDTTLVAGVAGGGGGGGYGGGGKPGTRVTSNAGAGNPGGAVRNGNSGKAHRALEDVRLVFDRNKGAIYAIYNRALRDDPSLQGKVVVELKIEPSGAVSGCRVVSSELHNPELEAKLVARIKLFDFGAKDVDLMNVTYPLDFLPS